MRLNAVATVLLAASAILAAVSAYFWLALPLPPPNDEPTPLPWIEGVTTERVEGDVEDINTDDIYYATPGGVWRHVQCVEVTVPLPDPDRPPEDPFFISDDEIVEELKSHAEIGSDGTTTFNRCVCGYRVEWTCTKVSRWITAEATLNGETYVRYLYDRETWPEDKTLTRKLNALVLTCSADEDCDFPCGASTPPYEDWGMQCRKNTPHRILDP